MPKVTILIAIYKGGNYVKSKIESLRLQTLHDFNVVLLNCQDLEGESAKFRERWAYSDIPNLYEIYYSQYVKLYKTWNDGIKITESDYIVNYNMDDQWHPDFLKKCVEFLDAKPEYAVVSSQVLITDTPNIVAKLDAG